MHRANTRAILSSLIAIAFVLSACAPAAAPKAATSAPAERVQLRLGVLNFMSHAPFIIADQAGYFEEQNLDVELVSFGSQDRDLAVALLQGQLDVGGMSMYTGTLSAISQGSDARAVADKAFLDPEAGCVPDAYAARTALLQSGELDQRSALRGKLMTLSVGGIQELTTELILESGGLTVDDVQGVEIRDMASRVEALRTGALDVTLLTEPWLTRARESGAGDVWLPLATMFPGFSSGFVFYGPTMLERGPEVGDRFMAAYLKAVRQYNLGKTAGNVAILSEFTQLEPAEVQAMCWPSFRPDGMADTQTLMDFQDWALQKGYVDAVMPLEQIWDPQYVQRAAALTGP